MDSSGTPLKPSGQEQHAKLSAKLFEFALSPLRRHFACEAETEQNSKSFALSLACSGWFPGWCSGWFPGWCPGRWGRLIPAEKEASGDIFIFFWFLAGVGSLIIARPPNGFQD